jgi:acyl carrier protein
MTDIDATRLVVEMTVRDAVLKCACHPKDALPIIVPSTVPLRDLDGFDSLCAIEAVVEIEAQLKLELIDDVFYVVVGKEIKPRSIEDVVNSILRQIEEDKNGQ